jgi:hypothetical protein
MKITTPLIILLVATFSIRAGAPFLGCWAWESAAITAVWGVEDQWYRDLPFYPRDLVEHFRNSTGPSATEASHAEAAEMRGTAGEVCAIGGHWHSIGVPVHGMTYTQGTPMQDLKSPYGMTVWRFLGAA